MTEQEFLAALGTRLRLARAANDVSQREVADDSDVHRTIVGRIERGTVNFRIDALRRLAQALHVPACFLVSGLDCPHRTPNGDGLPNRVLDCLLHSEAASVRPRRPDDPMIDGSRSGADAGTSRLDRATSPGATEQARDDDDGTIAQEDGYADASR